VLRRHQDTGPTDCEFLHALDECVNVRPSREECRSDGIKDRDSGKAGNRVVTE
jgi:hypothetical protein